MSAEPAKVFLSLVTRDQNTDREPQQEKSEIHLPTSLLTGRALPFNGEGAPAAGAPRVLIDPRYRTAVAVSVAVAVDPVDQRLLPFSRLVSTIGLGCMPGPATVPWSVEPFCV